jgi:hypothetical protein
MPRHSTVRDSATPAFTLELTQNVLRRVYAENHRRANSPVRFAQSKHPFDDDTDADLMDFPDTPVDVPTLPSYNTTAADNLGPEEIVELQARGIDPYATAANGTTRHQQAKLPLTHLIFAARFAGIFNTPEMARSLASPQAITLLSIPDDAERELFFEMFPDILEQTAQALDAAGIHLHGIAVAEFPNVQAASSSRGRKDFNNKVDRLIAEGKSVIVVARTRDDLPPSGKLLCTRTVALPPVIGDMVVEILRQTHSVTEKLSETKIRDRLPNDLALQSLLMPLFKSAFTEQTTLFVAARLRALTSRLDTGKWTSGPTLNAIHLPPRALQGHEASPWRRYTVAGGTCAVVGSDIVSAPLRTSRNRQNTSCPSGRRLRGHSTHRYQLRHLPKSGSSGGLSADIVRERGKGDRLCPLRFLHR